MTIRDLKVSTYDELRDKLPNSGLFDMLDCRLEIWCPESSTAEEVERMVHLIESMVNVIDVKVGSRIEDFVSDFYSIMIIEDIEEPKRRFIKRDKK